MTMGDLSLSQARKQPFDILMLNCVQTWLLLLCHGFIVERQDIVGFSQKVDGKNQVGHID